MKILFLDIDGVILAGRHWNSIENCSYNTIPSDTTGLLNDIVKRTDAQVVVSSTRRLDNFCRQELIAGGFTGAFHRRWRTPYVNGDKKRGYEIQEWLNFYPEVQRYAIVDDDSDILPKQKKFFVKTQYETGLAEEHVERLVNILNGV